MTICRKLSHGMHNGKAIYLCEGPTDAYFKLIQKLETNPVIVHFPHEKWNWPGIIAWLDTLEYPSETHTVNVIIREPNEPA